MHRWVHLLAVLLLIPTTTALADEGVLEINQTCAQQTGCFPGDGPGFPVTITSPGSYRLTSNLRQSYLPGVTTIETAVEISASAVRLDLNGFEISCSSPIVSTCSGDADGVVAAGSIYAGVRVSNGVVRGMPGDGIDLLTTAAAMVDGIQAIDNGERGILVANQGHIVDNVASRNGEDGIASFSGATVSGNTVSYNGGDGINTDSGCTISGNTVYQNDGDGIETSFGSSVFENTIRSNGGTRSGFGLRLNQQIAYRGNVVTDNAAGQVSGGVNLGENYCFGFGISSIACP